MYYVELNCNGIMLEYWNGWNIGIGLNCNCICKVYYVVYWNYVGILEWLEYWNWIEL